MSGSMDDVPRDPNAAAVPPARSDEQLMLEFAHGSEAAFAELFSRYNQQLFGFFRRRVADPTRAEELTQDAFVAVIRSSHRYAPTALFRTWLYSIGYKLLLGHRRKTAFRAMFFARDSDDHDPPGQNTMDVDLLMREALGKLDRYDREILLLREFEQLSYAEIAEVLRLPVNTVRSRLFRARMALRELLTAPSKTSIHDFAEAELEERI
jgi:RNA polymerase sigma-70 factor, ECF subfamily